MPSKPALPMVIRLAKKTVRNESRANDNANKTQSTKNGSHAASTMAQRLITLRSIRWRLSQLCLGPVLRLTEGICRFTERVWLQRPAGRMFGATRRGAPHVHKSCVGRTRSTYHAFSGTFDPKCRAASDMDGSG